MFDSNKYWENRYTGGGNSGAGSYNEYAEFKATIINKFISEYNIKTLLELGCGDGNQLSLFNIDEYFGFDVSDFIINKLKYKFPKYKFSTNIRDFTSADLTVSLDVILHLIDDEIYIKYMNNLFNYAKKYVIIFTENFNNTSTMAPHNKYRYIMHDIPPEFKLIETIENPLIGINTNAKFFIFKRINIIK